MIYARHGVEVASAWERRAFRLCHNALVSSCYRYRTVGRMRLWSCDGVAKPSHAAPQGPFLALTTPWQEPPCSSVPSEAMFEQ
jgi:hypothetical protein